MGQENMPFTSPVPATCCSALVQLACKLPPFSVLSSYQKIRTTSELKGKGSLQNVTFKSQTHSKYKVDSHFSSSDFFLPQFQLEWFTNTYHSLLTRLDRSLGLSKNQKSSFLILSRVNPGWIFYVDFKNINFFITGCHLPCSLFSLNWLL